ncbi:hypothetical protein PR202_ga06709 [Eleusine coracana subsp. coracana]|uniref:Uncharacterized protein n=1 Tax=Eleusine coracana subsp. coracana TaxID=191504 RepID=A0AAV5BWM6_ELECO|nr:hypothetical protein PR202_ga06709 [Eleusine coracana subsp. coracana]
MTAELPSFLLLFPLIVIPLIFLALSRKRVRGCCRSSATSTTSPARRRYEPLMMLRFCELRVLVASSMRTHDLDIASRPVGPTLQLAFRGAEGLIFAPYGDGWRRICTLELLSAHRVHAFRPVREDELRRLLGPIASAAAAGVPINLTERIKAFVSDSSVRAIIGNRSEHRDEFLRLVDETIPGLSLPDLFPSSRLAFLVSRAPRKIERQRRATLAIVDPMDEDKAKKTRMRTCLTSS